VIGVSSTAARSTAGHGARMAWPAVAPISFLPPPPNVRRALDLATRIAAAIGAPHGSVTVRSRPAGNLGRFTVAFASQAVGDAGGGGAARVELYASAPCEDEDAALEDLERKLFG